MSLLGSGASAIMDVWAPNHLITAFCIGLLISGRRDQVLSILPPKYFYRYHLYKILFYTFLWECFEHYLEEGMLGTAIQDWFQGIEYWGNRLITDPILVILAYVLVQRYSVLVIPARFIGCTWLFVHIIVFPHSLFLQQYLS